MANLTNRTYVDALIVFEAEGRRPHPLSYPLLNPKDFCATCVDAASGLPGVWTLPDYVGRLPDYAPSGVSARILDWAKEQQHLVEGLAAEGLHDRRGGRARRASPS